MLEKHETPARMRGRTQRHRLPIPKPTLPSNEKAKRTISTIATANNTEQAQRPITATAAQANGQKKSAFLQSTKAENHTKYKTALQ